MSAETKRLSLLVTQWYKRTQELEERVRELEAAKAKYENMLSALLIHGQPKGQLEERIAKAREILKSLDLRSLPISSITKTKPWEKVEAALAALEGK